MRKLVLGILAHVDAGKTTLSEALLYNSNAIKNIGRVDNGDAFLDTDSLEKQRGITIFSKQAVFSKNDAYVTLLDTPGHMDFSSEMERTLAVLDGAVLLINGADGIDGHTKLLWTLLEHYNVPTVIFVNKMDQPGVEKSNAFEGIVERFGHGIVDFTNDDSDALNESIALCDDALLDEFLAGNTPRDEDITKLLMARRLFPVYFGSALKNEGVDRLLDFLTKHLEGVADSNEFGARVFKITRDAKGERLTHVKLTGGSVSVKDVVRGSNDKINQIRIYSGEKYETRDRAEAGEVCAFVGLSDTKIGDGLGFESSVTDDPLIMPVQSFSLILPDEVSPTVFLPKMRILEDEDPTLKVTWSEKDKIIGISVMGEVGLEVIKYRIKERFGVDVSFGNGKVLYKETIASPVEGVGHYEPLKHYSEVHLLLEPTASGSGLSFDTEVSTDDLDLNWQRLILTHLREKEHIGVLTGSPITDMRITLVAGKAHLKHTEGGDFRQSTYRAIRQGLMKAENILLEPIYDFTLTVPTETVGRALSDLDRMNAKFNIDSDNNGFSVITGTSPVATMANYAGTLASYTKGQGELVCNLKGYAPCHNSGEVIESVNYIAEADLENTADSVFCSHGAGTLVPWYEVEKFMHLPAFEIGDEIELRDEDEFEMEAYHIEKPFNSSGSYSLGTDEIDKLLGAATGANSGANKKGSVGYLKRRIRKPSTTREYKESKQVEYKPLPKKPKVLLVDGYNVIFASKELSELAQINIDSARDKLMDLLCNYQGYHGMELILVYDAYKVRGGKEHAFDYHNIHVVYTREAQTADAYIEKFAHNNAKNFDITVATSDGLEQIIIRGEGCSLISSRELIAQLGSSLF